jgi:hypothetical protein
MFDSNQTAAMLLYDNRGHQVSGVSLPMFRWADRRRSYDAAVKLGVPTTRQCSSSLSFSRPVRPLPNRADYKPAHKPHRIEPNIMRSVEADTKAQESENNRARERPY